MAQQIMIRLLDDLEPTKEADETLKFGVDGVEYEIDLSSANASAFRKFTSAYIDAGRRVGGRRKRRNSNQHSTDDPEANGTAPMNGTVPNGTAPTKAIPRPTVGSTTAARVASPPAANFKPPTAGAPPRTIRPLVNMNLNRAERDAVRRWAPRHGHPIGDRGRIAAPIITAWREAGSPR